MVVYHDVKSPNYVKESIRVEFVVIHYTAGDFARSIDIFTNRQSKVSCHLLIAEDGKVYEVVKCWDGISYKAKHCGISEWKEDTSSWYNLNDYSIGIELVNKNGNIFNYSKAQYESLSEVISHLKNIYPSLSTPERVLGHEHVAGFRGKADPGICFDWNLFYQMAYPSEKYPERLSVCPKELSDSLKKTIGIAPTKRDEAVLFWHAISDITETSIRLIINR